MSGPEARAGSDTTPASQATRQDPPRPRRYREHLEVKRNKTVKIKLSEEERGLLAAAARRAGRADATYAAIAVMVVARGERTVGGSPLRQVLQLLIEVSEETWRLGAELAAAVEAMRSADGNPPAELPRTAEAYRALVWKIDGVAEAVRRKLQ